MTNEKKKKNIFTIFFGAIGFGINYALCSILFFICYIFLRPSLGNKVKGKENIKADDEARVFIANHYQLYGPIAMYCNFPFKFRPWIIDKMMEPEAVKKQMSIMVYNNYKNVPNWIKAILIASIKNLMVYVMKYRAKGISVSRENLRSLPRTLQISTETLEKGQAVAIFPELHYLEEGVNTKDFQTGFENLAKYHYQKTGKKISFYPMFISQVNKEMYIEKPIVFNPENDLAEEKAKIVEYLKTEMHASFVRNELENPKCVAKKAKIKAKRDKKEIKRKSKQEKKLARKNKRKPKEEK